MNTPRFRAGGRVSDILPGIEDERLRRLLAYWESKRQGRRFPARADLDPLDFHYLLGWISLLEVTNNPRRFRYRLNGSLLVERFGVDMTGKYLDEFPQPEFRELLEKMWGAAVEAGGPVHEFNNRIIDRHRYEFETLRLPLAANGETVDMLLVASVHRR